MIKSILIANRGEIAIRIAKTAKKMGIKTYAFLTHEEPNALYLESADEIIDVSAEKFTNIFMDVNRIVECAVENGVDAIHPGYGFLSENPYLPMECENKGVIFIGPSHVHIEQMGNKGKARELAIKCGVPVLQGSDGTISTLDEAKQVAEKVGYPVIIKAVAGGGGKGMRVVLTKDDLAKMYKAAINEAKSVFGNGAVFIEKYITKPRHVEVQVLADKHGNVVHLFDRECSIQRKHQKLMEEAPSPALSAEMRQVLGNDAVKLCQETGYYNAGTVEYLVEGDAHYFMEMNTRVQVEHPVTEAITGIDIIEQQIRIAAGEKLALKQDEIQINGSAIEFRVNAEDVQADFSPTTGIVEELTFPEAENLRVDSGFTSGKVIPACYDSLVAKVIVTGNTREEAVAASDALLESVKVRGIKTTIPFFRKVLTTGAFVSGNYFTDFIQTELDQLHYEQPDEQLAGAILALQAYLEELNSIGDSSLGDKEMNPWKMKQVLK